MTMPLFCLKGIALFKKVLFGCFLLFLVNEFRIFDRIVSGNANRIILNNFDLESFNGTDIIDNKNFDSLHQERKHGRKNVMDDKANSLCSEYPSRLTGNVPVNNEALTSPTLDETINANPEITNGGHFSPVGCKSRHRVAIIIPFRDREVYLRILLAHMHPIWQRQEIDYKLYVISQSGNGLFNRAKLLNIGVSEAKKDGEYDCYVFQDVDLLLEDDRCLYWCHEENPRHISMHIDTFSYKPLKYTAACPPLAVPSYTSIHCVGGVTMLSRKQYNKVNGYSNIYWGWGGEDDDLFWRMWNRGYKVANPYGTQCSFKMVKHAHESSNSKNPARSALLFHAINRMDMEGFGTLRYRVLKTEINFLYTNITVDVGRPSSIMNDFMSQKFNWLTQCVKKMPWNM